MNTAIVTPQSTPSWVKSFVKNATMVQERVQLLEKALSKDGIPSSWRGIIWQALVTAPNHLTIMYPQLLKETCAFATMIDKDVEQCKDKEAVARILKAYSIYDGCVGYCPGMSYIVSVILSTVSYTDFILFFKKKCTDSQYDSFDRCQKMKRLECSSGEFF